MRRIVPSRIPNEIKKGRTKVDEIEDWSIVERLGVRLVALVYSALDCERALLHALSVTINDLGGDTEALHEILDWSRNKLVSELRGDLRNTLQVRLNHVLRQQRVGNLEGSSAALYLALWRQCFFLGSGPENLFHGSRILQREFHLVTDDLADFGANSRAVFHALECALCSFISATNGRVKTCVNRAIKEALTHQRRGLQRIRTADIGQPVKDQ